MEKEAIQLNNGQEQLAPVENVENFEDIREKMKEYYFKLKEETGKEDADVFALDMIKEIEQMPRTFPKMENDDYDAGFGDALDKIIKKLKN